MGGVSFLPEFSLGGFVVEITRKDTPPCSFPPIHNFQLYLSKLPIHNLSKRGRIDISIIELIASFTNGPNLV
jgi:hypothetical protein